MEDNIFKERVEAIISNKIRPYFLNHSGDIDIKEIRGGNVWVIFKGACKTCPAAQSTVEDVVEKFLREELGDDLDKVYLVNDTDKELLDFARALLNKKKTN